MFLFRKKRHVIMSVIRVIGIVLIWRGIWYILDGVDSTAFGGSHWWSSVAGVVAGVVILTITEGNLKALDDL